jgi:Protein of unknown function (DUF3309)
MILLLLLVVFVMCMGGLPNWGYHHYGYYPSGLLGIVLVVLLLLFLMGRL